MVILYVRNHLVNSKPDVVVNVVDSSSLERNLFLTTQLIDMNIKVVIALNMHDELLKKGAQFDYEALGQMIGVPIIPTIASKGKGIETGLKKKASQTGVSLPLLRLVMRRGMAAWKGGHRPGATQQQWAFARVNSFVTKSSGTWGGADKDLAKKVRGSK